MPYAKLKTELLAARDLRDAALRKSLAHNRWTVLQLSLNLPGPNKRPAGAGALFRWGETLLYARLPSLQKLAEESDALGPWALFTDNSSAVTSKQQALLIEETQPAGRLLDIDVYAPQGKVCDRQLLERQQRRCLLCGEAARDCMRLQRHRPEQLEARIDELLAPFRT